jgi:hypothetical protein
MRESRRQAATAVCITDVCYLAVSANAGSGWVAIC